MSDIIGDIFPDHEVAARIIGVEIEPDDDGYWDESEKKGETIYGVMYNQSAAMTLFSTTWKENVEEVLVTSNPGALKLHDLLEIDDLQYMVEEGPIDVAHAHEVYTIGLRIHKGSNT